MTLRPLAALLCGIVLSLSAATCFAQNPARETAENPPANNVPANNGPAKPADNSPDLDAIRAASQSFIAAFNKGDAKAVAAHWTENGEYIDEIGRTVSGREAIAAEYAAFFKAQPKSKIHLAIDSLKQLSSGAAIEEGRAVLDPAPPGASAISKYLVVHVKEGDQWLMSTVRDSRVELPSSYRNVADLEWLIGTWTAEEHGAKTVSVCRWIANKSFVERSYTITQHDGMTSSGVQIIGWNPEGGHVLSWNFGGDGGHAVGVWSPIADGWQAEVRGVTGDGTQTTAVNVLRKLDEKAYVWQSVNRTVGGQSVPDTDEIVLRRSEK
jgi:uncharacterized protein (TIGR02246 family)